MWDGKTFTCLAVRDAYEVCQNKWQGKAVKLGGNTQRFHVVHMNCWCCWKYWYCILLYFILGSAAITDNPFLTKTLHFISRDNNIFSSIILPVFPCYNHAEKFQCGARRSAVGWGTALEVGRSRVRFQMVSLEFFIDNPSGRTMTLGLTKPLAEMSTGNISWG